ncbi:MAG TPA: helix-turn-helix transcriptional regulator [Acidobacteriota bacterium]|nr:helix-turn-helix transcriptional regulator [Acidobacteriota bacterium]
MRRSGKSTSVINNYVGDCIRQIRIAKEIKVQDIAKHAGIPASSYSCLEGGRYKINLDNLFRILQALDADITDVWPQGNVPDVDIISEEDMQKVVDEAMQSKPPVVSLDDVVEAVCRVCGIKEIRRGPEIKAKQAFEAQALCACLVRELPQLSLTSLSHKLGVHISSLSRRATRMMEMADEDPELEQKINDAREELHYIMGSED